MLYFTFSCIIYSNQWQYFEVILLRPFMCYYRSMSWCYKFSVVYFWFFFFFFVGYLWHDIPRKNFRILFAQQWYIVILWVIVKFVHWCIPRHCLWDLVLWWWKSRLCFPRQWQMFQRNLLPVTATLKMEAVLFSITLLTQIRLLKYIQHEKMF